jgi:hypothetical protein
MQTPRTILAEDAEVKKLINQDSKWLNVSLIKEIYKEEAWLICQIPIRYR